MRGSDGTRDVVAGFLRGVLPLKIPALRKAWNLDQGRLPDIGAISSGEMPENALTNVADCWVEVVNPRMLPGLRCVDITPAGDRQYHIRYACKIYIWCLGVDWDQAMTRRDMTVAAVRTSLLEYPTLTLAGGDTAHLVLEETWTEEYGIPVRTPNDSGRCWCSAVLAVDVRAEEDLADGRLRAPLGSGDRLLLSADGYGPGVPFPTDLPTPQDFQLDTTTGAAGANP